MEDLRQRIIVKILTEIQSTYEIDINNMKNILENNLNGYTLTIVEENKDKSDLLEKINFFLGVKTLDGLAESSIKRYTEELRLFSRYMNKSVISITINDLREYLNTIQNEKKLKKTTLNNKISILKTFFEFLYSEEIISKDPSVKLKALKVDKKSLRTALSTEEMEELRNACKDIKEKAFVEFLFSTGCRISEVVKANKSDINWNDNSLIVHGKGSKDRIVYFSIKCKLYLKEYFTNRSGDNDSIFIGNRFPYNSMTISGLERAMTRIADRTIMKNNVSPHKLRHSMASSFLQKGADLVTISSLLGHASIATTQIYAHMNDTVLKSTYNKYV